MFCQPNTKGTKKQKFCKVEGRMTRWNKTVATMCTLHFSTLFLNIIYCIYCDFKRVTCPKPERQHNLHVGDIVNIAFYR